MSKKFCVHCGKQFQDGAKFCSICGGVVTEQEIFDNTSTTAANIDSDIKSMHITEKKSAKTNTRVFFGITGVILVIAILVYIIAFSSGAFESTPFEYPLYAIWYFIIITPFAGFMCFYGFKIMRKLKFWRKAKDLWDTIVSGCFATILVWLILSYMFWGFAFSIWWQGSMYAGLFTGMYHLMKDIFILREQAAQTLKEYELLQEARQKKKKICIIVQIVYLVLVIVTLLLFAVLM